MTWLNGRWRNQLMTRQESIVLNIPLGQWHIDDVLESGTVKVKVKVKDSPYEPLGQENIMK